MREKLLYFSFIHKGNNFKIWRSLQFNELINKEYLELFKNTLINANINYITIKDEEYPKILKESSIHPYVLFYKGDLKLLNKELITLASDNLEDQNLFSRLKQSLPIIAKEKGLILNSNKKFDQLIQQEYSKFSNNIIHVLPCGFDFYNQELVSNHLYISKYPNNCHIKHERIRESNLLVATLSEKIIVYNSNKKSGIQNLANSFASLGKEVYCYSSHNKDDGNTLLLHDGANLITQVGKISYF